MTEYAWVQRIFSNEKVDEYDDMKYVHIDNWKKWYCYAEATTKIKHEQHWFRIPASVHFSTILPTSKIEDTVDDIIAKVMAEKGEKLLEPPKSFDSNSSALHIRAVESKVRAVQVSNYTTFYADGEWF